jgi:iron(III) transport system ATP-binding protein
VSAPGLGVEGLAKRHPGAARPLFEGLSLAVPPGRVLALLGESGSGKTTLLRIVAGLDVADRGRVSLGGRTLSDPAPRVPPESRGLGMVFQHLELWPHMTVAENVAFGLPGRPRGRRAAAHPDVRRLAAETGLPEEMLSRTPASLSGGERQRVAIARTLAARPEAILSDEPLANLDPSRRGELRDLLRDVARRHGVAMLHVTHDAEEAMDLGDEVAVLAGGRIAECRRPADLYRAPRSLATARALGPVSALPAERREGAVWTALGPVAPVETPPDGPALALLRPEALEVTDGEGAVVVDARPHGPAWAVRARVGEHVLAGRSATERSAGASVRLSVVGRVPVVPAEAPR